MSPTATFRFHGELEWLLPRGLRGRAFEYAIARAATLKNAIEALGVPHTEVGRLAVNGSPATLDRTVRPGDAIEVFPWPADGAAAPVGERRFVADAHLGALARYLRMLGFDTVHANDLADAAIRRLARDELRIVLSRDRELLKCRDIHRGCLVRALRPDEQLRGVVLRYGLAASATPFTRCLRCNLPLDAVDKAAIEARLPDKVRVAQTRFMTCHGCGRLYWPGTHHARMQAALRALLPDPAAGQALT